MKTCPYNIQHKNDKVAGLKGCRPSIWPPYNMKARRLAGLLKVRV